LINIIRLAWIDFWLDKYASISSDNEVAGYIDELEDILEHLK